MFGSGQRGVLDHLIYLTCCTTRPALYLRLGAVNGNMMMADRSKEHVQRCDELWVCRQPQPYSSGVSIVESRCRLLTSWTHHIEV